RQLPRSTLDPDTTLYRSWVPISSFRNAEANASGSPVNCAPEASAWYSRERLTAICTTPAATGPSNDVNSTANRFGRSSSLPPRRSEEHTSELQSRENLVC